MRARWVWEGGGLEVTEQLGWLKARKGREGKGSFRSWSGALVLREFAVVSFVEGFRSWGVVCGLHSLTLRHTQGGGGRG